jgi:hypothetical protein
LDNSFYYKIIHNQQHISLILWAWVKRKLRLTCDYALLTLEAELPIVLDEIESKDNINTLKKFQRKALRYMHAYHLGSPPFLAEWAATKYSSHRRVTDNLDTLFEEQYAEAQKKDVTALTPAEKAQVKEQRLRDEKDELERAEKRRKSDEAFRIQQAKEKKAQKEKAAASGEEEDEEKKEKRKKREKEGRCGVEEETKGRSD